MAGIYPGNPKRSTATPTTERMLQVFDNLNLQLIPYGDQLHCKVTTLTAVQTRIMHLWDLPVSLYTDLEQVRFPREQYVSNLYVLVNVLFVRLFEEDERVSEAIVQLWLLRLRNEHTFMTY